MVEGGLDGLASVEDGDLDDEVVVVQVVEHEVVHAGVVVVEHDVVLDAACAPSLAWRLA